MSHGQRVLVVDGVSEIRDVLEAVLAPRGLQVEWMRSSVQSPLTPDRPDILVIDAEAAPVDSRRATWDGVPQVIIGTPPRTSPTSDRCRQYLPKPFQYGELIEAIERLLPAA
ncbi:MAG TPA: response regulator [Planctomycetaceae bacterium]|nr:response regulator [Planctomycetaceae bacterium]